MYQKIFSKIINLFFSFSASVERWIERVIIPAIIGGEKRGRSNEWRFATPNHAPPPHLLPRKMACVLRGGWGLVVFVPSYTPLRAHTSEWNNKLIRISLQGLYSCLFSSRFGGLPITQWTPSPLFLDELEIS